MLSRQPDSFAAAFYGDPTGREEYDTSLQRPSLQLHDSTGNRPAATQLGPPTVNDKKCQEKLARQDKVLRCAERHARCLKKELCYLQAKLDDIRPKIDPNIATCAEAICNLILCALRRSAEKNEIGAVALIPEMLSILDSLKMPFESLNVQKNKLKELLTDGRLMASASAAVSTRFDGSQFASEGQREIIAQIETIDVPFDLKYFCAATGDKGWEGLKSWWIRSPPSLRWLTIVTERKAWLAYVDLYMRAPEDLRWAAVCMDDPRWLHFCTRWKFIPVDTKLKALQCGDISFLRGSDFHGCRFELWDCNVGEDMMLIPAELRGLQSSKLINRCICCPIHCRWGTIGERLDLQELKDLLAKIDALLAKDRAERELKESEWQKRLAERENEWRQKLLKQEVEIDRIKRELMDANKQREKERESCESERQKLERHFKEQLNASQKQLEVLKARSSQEAKQSADQIDKLHARLREQSESLTVAKSNADKMLAQEKVALENQLKQAKDECIIKQAEADKAKEQMAREIQTLRLRLEEMSKTTTTIFDALNKTSDFVKEKVEVKKIAPKDEAKKIEPKEEAKKIASKEEVKKIEPKEEAEKIASKEEVKKIEPKEEAKKIALKEEAKKIEPKEEAKKIALKKEAKKIEPKEEAKKIASKEEAKKIEPKIAPKKQGESPKLLPEKLSPKVKAKQDVLNKTGDQSAKVIKKELSPKTPDDKKPMNDSKKEGLVKKVLPVKKGSDDVEKGPDSKIKSSPPLAAITSLEATDSEALLNKLRDASGQPLPKKAMVEQMQAVSASASSQTLRGRPPPPEAGTQQSSREEGKKISTKIVKPGGLETSQLATPALKLKIESTPVVQAVPPSPGSPPTTAARQSGTSFSILKPKLNRWKNPDA